MKSILLYCLCFFTTLSLSAQFQVEGLLHIEDGVALYIQDDIVINTTDGIVDNSGLMEIEGDWAINTDAAYNGNTAGAGMRKVNFKNDNFNTAGSQTIIGAMNGSNAFHNLEITNTGTDGVVDMTDNITVDGTLTFSEGRLRTDLSGHGTNGMMYANEVHVTNTDLNAITGHNMAASTDKYIEGRLRRNISGMGQYDFPIGIMPSMLDGSEPFSLDFTSAAPMSNIITFFQNGATTTIGNTTACDVNEDGGDDEVTIDCAFGRWNITASDTDYDYNITLHPGANLQNVCPDATEFFVAKDGLTELCSDMDGMPGITRTGLSGFSSFDVPTASISSIVLPVSLVNFTAQRTGKVIQLDWQTDLEINTRSFEVERSFDARVYENIGTVAAVGNSEVEQDYTLTDNDLPAHGIIYYRLRIVDFDGREELSETRSVNINKDNETVSVYPNPFAENLIIDASDLESDSKLLIFNSLGQLLQTVSISSGASSQVISVKELQNGVYHLISETELSRVSIGTYLKQ